MIVIGPWLVIEMDLRLIEMVVFISTAGPNGETWQRP
jgi:hypothetical protein